MEVFSITISLALVALTLFFIIRRSSNGGAKLPPGSFGWPVLGESVEFLFGKPEKFVGDRMRKYSADIFKTKVLGEKTVVICGPAGHKFLFSNELKYFTAFRPHPMQHLFRSYKDNKSAAPPAQPTVQNQAVDESKTIRQPGFLKPEALMRVLGLMDSVAQQQIKTHCEDKTIVKVHPLAKSTTLTLACHFFLGINNPDRIAQLVKHFDDVTVGMHCLMINLPGTIFYKANKAANEIRKELVSVIAEKKRAMESGSPSRDILTHMIAFRDPSGQSMPDAELADKMMGLLTAGYSTVATTITFLMKYVGLNPEIYERIRAEQLAISASKKPGQLLEWEDMSKMKYSWNVICETMRMVPPLQGTFRDVLTEFTYAGYTIPEGWKLYWTVSSTNMNPEYFKNPETFNPSRSDEGEAPPPYTYVPFGGGPRLCPGKEYARLAILSFVHNVVKMYRWEVIDPTEEVEGDMMPEPQQGLPIRFYRI